MFLFRNKTCVPSGLLLKCFLALAIVLFVSIAFVEYLGLNEMRVRVMSTGGELFVGMLILMFCDWIFVLRMPLLFVERRMKSSIAVGRWSSVLLIFKHRYQHLKRLQFYDGLSSGIEFTDMPNEIVLESGKHIGVTYELKPLNRDLLSIDDCHVSIPSPLGCWRVQSLIENKTQVKVYPDFAAISTYMIMVTDDHESQIGIIRKPRRGEGLDFQQLREYRRGDSLWRIDWKATAKRHKLISKEYQGERDQQIVLLIDSGRRMRALDDKLSHFDHSLNAMLLVSYIALRQGDSVSVLSFGETQRWIPPQKGVENMKAILNGVYDLHAENSVPDYVSAAEKLSSLQRKRSLIILVTNTRDEDADELLLATKQLKQQHVVLLANIRETVIDQMQNAEIHSFDGAHKLCWCKSLFVYEKRRS